MTAAMTTEGIAVLSQAVKDLAQEGVFAEMNAKALANVKTALKNTGESGKMDANTVEELEAAIEEGAVEKGQEGDQEADKSAENEELTHAEKKFAAENQDDTDNRVTLFYDAEKSQFLGSVGPDDQRGALHVVCKEDADANEDKKKANEEDTTSSIISKPWFWIVIGAGLLTVVGIVVFFVVKRAKSDDDSAFSSDEDSSESSDEEGK
jgi:hypothetical protein